MPPRKLKRSKKTKITKSKSKASVVVTINSNNKRKTTAAKAAPSSNHSPPFMILQQPAPAPQPMPFPQYLPQPIIQERQRSQLAPADRLPLLQDLAVEQLRGSTDTIRENEMIDDVAQNIRNEEMRRRRMQTYQPLFTGGVPTTENPMLERPQMQENVNADNVLDEQAVLPSGGIRIRGRPVQFTAGSTPIQRIKNPVTGNMVLVGGKTYKDLVKSGAKFDEKTIMTG